MDCYDANSVFIHGNKGMKIVERSVNSCLFLSLSVCLAIRKIKGAELLARSDLLDIEFLHLDLSARKLKAFVPRLKSNSREPFADRLINSSQHMRSLFLINLHHPSWHPLLMIWPQLRSCTRRNLSDAR